MTGMLVDYNPYTGTIAFMYPLTERKKFTQDQIKSGEAKKVLMERIRSYEGTTKRRITKVEGIKYHGTNKHSYDKEVGQLLDVVHGK